MGGVVQHAGGAHVNCRPLLLPDPWVILRQASPQVPTLSISIPGLLPCRRLPTFLYAMPFSPTKIFLEETSLVARPIIPFPELKLRLEKRMQHLGLKVRGPRGRVVQGRGAGPR